MCEEKGVYESRERNKAKGLRRGKSVPIAVRGSSQGSNFIGLGDPYSLIGFRKKGVVLIHAERTF